MAESPEFIKGLQLSEMFFREEVKPILDKYFPKLPYSATLWDYGSEIFGFDTPQSRDHGWGPRVNLLVEKGDSENLGKKIIETLGNELPLEFHGYSTNFGAHDDGTSRLDKAQKRPIQHGVSINPLPAFLKNHLGFDLQTPLSEVDWLLIPQQRLRMIQSGKVFYDGLNRLETLQKQLAWYPQDVWIYLLACQWQRISQEEAFMARCGDVGDEIGSGIIGARMVNELMSLCFLMEKSYAPYAKWFGTAFKELSCARDLEPIFEAVLRSRDWKEREKNLSAAYLSAIRKHNSLQLTEAMKEEAIPYYSRPYLVPFAGRIAEALYSVIKSPAVLSLPKHVGAVSQFVRSTDVGESPENCQRLKTIYFH